MLVSSDDQVKAYIKKIMGQLDKWMVGGKISKLVVVITSKDTGEHVERWQFDVCPSSHTSFINTQTEVLTQAPTGPNILQALLKKVLQEIHRQRECRTRILGPSPSRENRRRDPSRDPVHLPADNRISDVPTTVGWGVHV